METSPLVWRIFYNEQITKCIPDFLMLLTAKWEPSWLQMRGRLKPPFIDLCHLRFRRKFFLSLSQNLVKHIQSFGPCRVQFLRQAKYQLAKDHHTKYQLAKVPTGIISAVVIDRTTKIWFGRTSTPNQNRNYRTSTEPNRTTFKWNRPWKLIFWGSFPKDRKSNTRRML